MPPFWTLSSRVRRMPNGSENSYSRRLLGIDSTRWQFTTVNPPDQSHDRTCHPSWTAGRCTSDSLGQLHSPLRMDIAPESSLDSGINSGITPFGQGLMGKGFVFSIPFPSPAWFCDRP